MGEDLKAPSETQPPQAEVSPGSEEPHADHQRRRTAVGRTIFGTILIALGAQALVETLTGIDLDLVILAVGLALLAGWWGVGHYGLLVGGGVVSGIGLGQLLQSLFPSVSAPFTLISLALGFAFIGVATRRGRGNWALITSGILAAVALLDLGTLLSIPVRLADALLPIALIAAGVVLLLRSSLPRRAAQWLIAGLAALVVISLLSGSGRMTLSPFGLFGGHVVSEVRFASVPSDAEVVQVVARSGDVSVSSGPRLSITARVVARGISDRQAREALDRARLVTEPSGESVRVFFDGGGTSASADFFVTVPEDTSVEVITASGDVSGSLSEAKVSVTSGSGDVRLDLSRMTDGEVAVRTGSGDVEITIPAEAGVSLRTGSGDITVVDGSNVARFSDNYEREGSDGSLLVRTGSGDVRMSVNEEMSSADKMPA